MQVTELARVPYRQQMRWVILELTLAGFLLNSFKENLSKKNRRRSSSSRFFLGKTSFSAAEAARKAAKAQRTQGGRALG
jgi:hypothetical protein